MSSYFCLHPVISGGHVLLHFLRAEHACVRDRGAYHVPVGLVWPLVQVLNEAHAERDE